MRTGSGSTRRSSCLASEGAVRSAWGRSTPSGHPPESVHGSGGRQSARGCVARSGGRPPACRGCATCRPCAPGGDRAPADSILRRCATQPVAIRSAAVSEQRPESGRVRVRPANRSPERVSRTRCGLRRAPAAARGGGVRRPPEPPSGAVESLLRLCGARSQWASSSGSTPPLPGASDRRSYTRTRARTEVSSWGVAKR